jgi:hypothetical protein
MAAGGIVAFAGGGDTGFRLSGAENPLSMMGESGDFLARINELKKNNPWMSEQQLKAKIASEAVMPQISAEEKKMYEGRPAPTPLNYDRPTAKQINAATVPSMASTTVARPQASASPAVSGIGRVSYEAPTDFSAEYDANLRPDISAQDAMAKFQGLMGTDVGRQKLNERLAAMESKAIKEEEQAPWMALAKAGLGMAGGKSQFAVQNIAEGAQAGLKDYSEARERLANKEEKRFSIQSQLAQAERAEKAAAATYGLQSEEAARAGREANRLAKLGYKANLASDKAKGEFEAKKGNLEAELTRAKLDEDSAWHKLQYKADMARTGVMGANAQFTKEQAQATNLLKQIMAPKMAALKNAGYAEEDAYDAVYGEALAKLPPNMQAALGYNADYIKGLGAPNTNDYIKKYGLTPKTQPK